MKLGVRAVLISGAVIAALLLLINLGKPELIVVKGNFTADKVFGSYVARDKSMSPREYGYKIFLNNLADFSAVKYLEENRLDVANNSGWTATILTNNPADVFADPIVSRTEWLRFEIRGQSGKLEHRADPKLFPILWRKVCGFWGRAVSPSQKFARRTQARVDNALNALKEAMP